MYLFCGRLKTSLVAGVTGEMVEISASVPSAKALLQVSELCKSRPCDKRLVTFVCNASYQLSPSGAQCMLVMLPNCGKGRKDWATDELAGNPAYGNPKPR